MVEFWVIRPQKWCDHDLANARDNTQGVNGNCVVHVDLVTGKGIVEEWQASLTNNTFPKKWH